MMRSILGTLVLGYIAAMVVACNPHPTTSTPSPSKIRIQGNEIVGTDADCTEVTSLSSGGNIDIEEDGAFSIDNLHFDKCGPMIGQWMAYQSEPLKLTGNTFRYRWDAPATHSRIECQHLVDEWMLAHPHQNFCPTPEGCETRDLICFLFKQSQ